MNKTERKNLIAELGLNEKELLNTAYHYAGIPAGTDGLDLTSTQNRQVAEYIDEMIEAKKNEANKKKEAHPEVAPPAAAPPQVVRQAQPPPPPMSLNASLPARQKTDTELADYLRRAEFSVALTDACVQSFVEAVNKFPDLAVVWGKKPDSRVSFCGSIIGKCLKALSLPIEIVNIIPEQLPPTQEGYNNFAYIATARNTITGLTMPVRWEMASELPFFTTRYRDGKRIKLTPAEVNETHVRTAAFNGLRKDAILTFLGLRSLTVKEAKDLGMHVDKFRTVDFKGK